MRDDLFEGQQVLRIDYLERLEMMAVQLDEASAFLARKTVSHARLAEGRAWADVAGARLGGSEPELGAQH